MAAPDPDPVASDHPELDEVEAFVAAQAQRHRRFVAAVLAASAAMVIAGALCLWIAQDDNHLGYVAGGLLLTGLGVVGLVRGVWSLVTDIDTRDRGDWETVVGNEDVQGRDPMTHDPDADDQDFDAAVGRVAQALRGLMQDHSLTGLEHLPRVTLAARAPPPAAKSSRAEAGPDAPDGRHRKDGRAAPGPLPDADRQEGEASLVDVLGRPVGAGEKLQIIDQEVLGDCRRCKLHRGRTKLVFGAGNPEANLVFVGEGPGAEEDRQGEPFVGRAGQLLNQMIKAMGHDRDDVYICNVVKCRPPNNRDPEPDEVEACEPFLKAQLGVLRPKVIVGLGRCASQTLLRNRRAISNMRGQWFQYEGVDFMPTFHPSYLLRSPEKKREAWHDLQLVMKRLAS